MAIQNPHLYPVMQQESAGNPRAVSPKGAQGLMQIMPETARDPGFGVTPLQGWDGINPMTASAEEQMRFGNDYLNAMSKHFGGDVAKTLAAYNAGPGAVQKYGGVPPFQETQNYVKKITQNSGQGTQMASNNSDWRSRAQPVMSDAGAPVQLPTQNSGWRARAQVVTETPPAAKSDWRSRAQPVTDDSFTGKVSDAYNQNINQMQESADAYVAGEQTLPETAVQQGLSYASIVPDTVAAGLSSVMPDYMKDIYSSVGSDIMRSPVGSYIEKVPQMLQEFKTEFPRASRNIGAGLDAVSLATLPTGAQLTTNVAKSVGKEAIDTAANVRKTMNAPTPVTKTAAEMKEMGGAAFEQAEKLGTVFKPAEVSIPFSKAIAEVRPRPIAGKTITSEEKKLVSHLDEYKDLKGVNLSLDDVKRLDEGLTQKINANFVDAKTGLPDANGRKLMILQTKLRNSLDDIPDNAGNDALSNARKFWKAQIALNDLDTVAERAAMTQNAGTSLRVGYRNLFNDKDRIRGWPAEAKELLRKAATPSITDDALQLISSRLPAIIMGGTGNLGGAATAHIVGIAGRGLKAGIAAKQGAKVQQSIVDNTLGSLREVKVPEVSNVPLMLAAPNKMSKLPMSDTEINIARKLMEKKK